MWGNQDSRILVVGVEKVQPLWENVWQFLITLNVHPPDDPAIPLLGIYPRDMNM